MIASKPTKARNSKYAKDSNTLSKVDYAEKKSDKNLQNGGPQKDVVKAIKSAGVSKADEEAGIKELMRATHAELERLLSLKNDGKITNDELGPAVAGIFDT